MKMPHLLTVAALSSTLTLLSIQSHSLELRDCELTGSQGISLVQARCGTLTRPENPAEPGGRQIELRVAVIAALSPEPKADAFTVINGGPGGSSIALYADSAGVFEAIRRERDIVVVDQRGTGDSGAMNCPELNNLAGGYDRAMVIESTAECLTSLDADPRYYTTSIAIRDLDAVRETLGYEQLDVYGVSYGTRVAMHYARHFPDRVRTLVIDGVVPPELALGPAAALNAQRTFERQLERCRTDNPCAEAFPDLAQKFTELARRLRQTPVAVSLPDPITGDLQEIEVGVEHLAVTVRLLSYTPETAALIPLIIEEAYSNKNYRPIASNALRIMDQLGNQISVGMHNAVVCAEDVPFLDDINWDELDATYMGRDQVDALIATCEIWPAGVLDEDLRSPLILDTPTLILSGTEDPITPPFYGEQVEAQLTNAQHLIAPGQGHGVFNRGCIPGLIAQFVEQADWQDFDAACVKRLSAQPFFIDSMGPAP